MILSSFLRTECCIEEKNGAIRRDILSAGKHLTYFISPHKFFSLPDLPSTIGKNFPVVLRSDGSLWAEASLYLLERFELNPNISNDTLQSIANDLAAYRSFLDSENIDFNTVSAEVFFRPTYLFRAYLKRLIVANKLKPSTANRRISRIVELYRWLEDRDIFKSEFPLWRDKLGQINFTNSYGVTKVKPVVSTDLSIKKGSISNFGKYIVDGEKLKPLNVNEQKLLIDVLNDLNNIEMKLIFLLALFTGARMQSILTLRLSNFDKVVSEDEFSEVRLAIGGDSLVETKYNKKLVIYMPTWLYRKIKIYINSPRAIQRQKKKSGILPEQYAFLTNRGDPYYAARNSATTTKKSGLRGETVRQFIKDQLIPKAKKIDSEFAFSFHWLRATYAMNLLDLQLEKVNCGKITLGEALNFVRERMGHSSIKITERYLNYRKLSEFTKLMEQEYYMYLQYLISRVV